MVTLYDALGVREDASDDEIKRAYRKAAMRAHPDRNQGREAAAHDAFQEIKQAYAILSDPVQRRVYDEAFAAEMNKLRVHEEQEARAARERTEREARAEKERYEQYVALAIRHAERGKNRDVVFGVLLGRGCGEGLAERIADGVAAFSAARRPDSTERSAGAQADEAKAAKSEAAHDDRAARARATATPVAEDTPAPDERADRAAHSGLFTTLWHGVFGLRS